MGKCLKFFDNTKNSLLLDRYLRIDSVIYLVCICQSHFIYAIFGEQTLVIVSFFSYDFGYIGNTMSL